jgi:hypothetical protein
MKNPPFLQTYTAFAVVILTQQESAERAAYIDRLDAFHALIEQLPKNSALLPLLLTRRYLDH